MTGLPTLTLKQPYASLVMAGVKTIETRSWAAPKDLVGQRIGIHAGQAWDRKWTRCAYDDADFTKYLLLDDLSCRFSYDRIGNWAVDKESLPIGVILGTAVLAACLPMGRCYDNDSVPHLCFSGDDLLLHSRMDEPWPDGETGRDVTDQARFGFFEPGNSAWLLEDVKPTTEQCPWCAGMDNGRHGGDGCPVCEGAGNCDPVPVKGQQKVWRWNP